MAIRKGYGTKRSSNRPISKRRVKDSRPIRSKKPVFPRTPILTKIHNQAPQKKIRKVPGVDDRFEAFDEVLTPFGRACQIEAEKTEKSPYIMRDDLDYSLGSFSVVPANKERIASDEGSDEGLNIVSTEKVIRNSKGIIISTEDSEDAGESYVIASTKYLFDILDYERTIDIEFSELALTPTQMDGPNKSPIIIDLQCYPGHGLLDGSRTDGWHIQTLIDIGEPSYQVEANNNVVLLCDAYSYIDNDGTRQNDDLSFTWRFTADGMGTAMNSVVGNGEPVLRLMNVQQQQRGRYTCEVSNEKGMSSTRAVFINPIGGILVELDDNGLPTGNHIRDEEHDNKFSQFDSYWDYDPVGIRWYLAEWNGSGWIEGTDEKPVQNSPVSGQYFATDAPKVILDKNSPEKLAADYAASWVKDAQGKWKFNK